MPTIKLATPWHVSRALDEVRNAPLGYVVSIKEPTRNLDQSAKMWALIGDIMKANVAGYQPTTKERWKCRFMHALDHEVEWDMGLDGKPYLLGTSSSALSVRQMNDLITFIEAWGAQHGVAFTDKTQGA